MHSCSYCLRMIDKRQRVTKVKCKINVMILAQNSHYILLWKKNLIFVAAHLQRTENFTIIEHEKQKLEIYINLQPHDHKSNYENID